MLINNFEFPDDEWHFKELFEKNNNRPYQVRALAMAFGQLKHFNRAIDIGAHVGLMTIPMSKMFKEVIAYELALPNYKYLYNNTIRHGCKNVLCYNSGVSNKSGKCNFVYKKGNSGAAEIIAKDKCNKVGNLIVLDDIPLMGIDFIKIDVQNHEIEVLQGAIETLRKYKPVIMVETVGEKREYVKKFLNKIGYKNVANWKKDQIYAP